ncbi:hypothetical protein CXU13_12105 [Akkermansia muciniphila]|nr:hypothetical protein CXU13_12105 [Akkermansia muciniphila]
MVECMEWSHEYMTADNKPSHIDDAGKVNISITIDKIAVDAEIITETIIRDAPLEFFSEVG